MLIVPEIITIKYNRETKYNLIRFPIRHCLHARVINTPQTVPTSDIITVFVLASCPKSHYYHVSQI